MKFSETHLTGVFNIDMERFEDDRGYFAELFHESKYADAMGLLDAVTQVNISYNRSRGTLRGMHLQAAPRAQAKLVRCLRGSVFDVALNLDIESDQFGQWYGVELTAENGNMLFIPEGFAHGYQALEDDSEVMYLTFDRYSPEHERGVMWDDPKFGIEWPIGDPTLSEKDTRYDYYDGTRPHWL